MARRAARAERRRAAEPAAALPRPRSPLVKPLLIVALVLLATIDDRHAGKVSDGRQMIRTAVAITETGELGQARGAVWTATRPEGDAVSRYGMGMTLAQLPAAFLAPRVERALGPGTSQPLFLVASILSVLLAAWAAAVAARHLGADARGQAIAVLLASLGSPLAAYAAQEFSEPLQAASLAVAYAASLRSRDSSEKRGSLGWAALAGFAAGWAVLTKSNLLAVAPLALLPLLTPAALLLPRLLAALAGALPGLGLWLGFEIVRFGKPLSSYGGTSFSHPFLDGLWRLLVGPNRGILLFFPALAVAAWAIVRALRAARLPEVATDGAATEEGSVPSKLPAFLAAGGAFLPFLSLLGQASAWWAWHGVGGWGPRLLIPGLPLLAAYAAPLVGSWSRRATAGFVAASIALNALPLLQHPAPIDIYTMTCKRARVDEAFARTLPAFTVRRGPDGVPVVSADHVLAKVPAASPFVVYPWFLASRLSGDPADVARRLEKPPWIGARPDLGPDITPFPPEVARRLAPPVRLSFWGRGFFRGPDDVVSAAAYDEALADQVVRAQQQRKLERALALAEKLSEVGPGPDADALLAETYRLLGRGETLASFFGSLPPERRANPRLGAVLALYARDRHDETNARKFLTAVAPAFPGTPVEKALGEPLSAWPPDLSSLTAPPVEEVATGLPELGERK